MPLILANNLLKQLNCLLLVIFLPLIVVAQTTPQCPPLDKQGHRSIDPVALNALTQCIAKDSDTKKLYFDTTKNQYTQQRQQLHQTIINHFLQGRSCERNKQPLALFTGGGPGAGKTSFLKKHYPWALSQQLVMVSSDSIRERLPEYKGWNATNTQAEANDINRALVKIATHAACKYNFVYDSTMNQLDYYSQFIPQLKLNGYQVFIIYIAIPSEVAKQRALQRYQTSGRYVPLSLIAQINQGTLVVFNQIKTMADGYIIVDGLTGKITKTHGLAIPKILL